MLSPGTKGAGHVRFRVLLIESDEGFTVSCPALRGCHSQGATREEALANTGEAIREWLEAEEIDDSVVGVYEDEVVV